MVVRMVTENVVMYIHSWAFCQTTFDFFWGSGGRILRAECSRDHRGALGAVAPEGRRICGLFAAGLDALSSELSAGAHCLSLDPGEKTRPNFAAKFWKTVRLLAKLHRQIPRHPLPTIA